MLPKTLTKRLQCILGGDFDATMQSFAMQKNGFFRVNTLKSSAEEVTQELDSKEIQHSSFYKDEIFTFPRESQYAIKGTDAFYQGKIYLQSLASQIPVRMLDPQKGEKILDVCAAPGSKTTQIAMMTENQSDITALEKNQIRFDKLNYNIRLQGAESITTHKIDALKFLEQNEEIFDKILLDVPCSAEGRILIENKKTYGFWSLENIRKKSELQYELICKAYKNLKKGGMIIYSTCTLAPEENECVIAQFLQSFLDASLEKIELNLGDSLDFIRKGIDIIHLPKDIFLGMKDINISPEQSQLISRNTLRILPTEYTEGFFIVKMKKN